MASIKDLIIDDADNTAKETVDNAPPPLRLQK